MLYRAPVSTLLLAALALVGAACGAQDTSAPPSDGATADAAATGDAAADDAGTRPDATTPDEPPDAGLVDDVVEVSPCPAQVASVVTAPGFAFTITDSTISSGDVVRFTMPGDHSVVSGTSLPGDGQFAVGFNQTKCFRFQAAGTYRFVCNPHVFSGTLTVGP